MQKHPSAQAAIMSVEWRGIIIGVKYYVHIIPVTCMAAVVLAVYWEKIIQEQLLILIILEMFQAIPIMALQILAALQETMVVGL